MQLQEAKEEAKCLSVEECRDLLGKDGEQMSDQQVEAFRDAIYTVVDSVLDKYVEISSVCPENGSKHSAIEF